MARLDASIFLLILQVHCNVSGIIIREYPQEKPNIPVASPANLKNVEVSNNLLSLKLFRPSSHSEDKKNNVNDVKKINHPKAKPTSSAPSVAAQTTANNLATRVFVRRAQLPNGYVSYAKPIHETDADLSSNRDHFDGYFYKLPGTSDTYFYDEDKPKKAHHYRQSDDLLSAILTLDRILKPLRGSESYNSHLHPPLNPVLALILSRYGKYITGRSKSHLYAYTASNNMHNNQPFGQYKYECDENPSFVK